MNKSYDYARTLERELAEAVEALREDLSAFAQFTAADPRKGGLPNRRIDAINALLRKLEKGLIP